MTVSEIFKTHEKLILALIAAGVLWVGIGKIDTLIQHHDDANLKQAQTIAAVQSQKDAAIAAQVAEDSAAFAALQAKMQAQATALEQANIALATALTKQQKTDATLPPTDLVARWNTLVPSANVTVSTNGETLPNSGAVATVQQLERIPVQQETITNDQTLIANGNALAVSQEKQVTDLTSEVSGLKLQSVDDLKVCNARVKVETDKVHKARRRWFLIGYVAGFLTRSALIK